MQGPHWDFTRSRSPIHAVVAPVPLSPLPIGVQIICAPWREDVALRIAHALEQQGVATAQRPPVQQR